MNTKGLLDAVVQFYQNLRSNDCQMVAAALTFQTMLALVPGLTIGYLALSAFGADVLAGQSIEAFIFKHIVPESVGAVQSYLKVFSEQAQALSVPSAALLAVTAVLMLNTIEHAFNRIWRVSEPRSGLRRGVVYAALLILGPMLLVTGWSVTTYLLSMPYVSNITQLPFVFWILPFLTSTLMYTLTYAVIPNSPVKFIHALLGGVSVGLVFEFARWLFSLLMQYSDLEVIYGAFAVLPGLLLWVYLSWFIILAGGEWVALLGRGWARRNM
ncbi:MAG: YihY family inner membrane protein [Pseudomonadales bacterium]